MQKRIRQLLKVNYQWLFWSWLLFILIASFLPASEIPEITFLLSPDKIVHFILYAVLVIFMKLAYSKMNLLIIIGFSILLGVSIEIMQPILSDRFFDNYDIVANSIGTFIGIIVLKFIY